jgi:hypothetical protein
MHCDGIRQLNKVDSMACCAGQPDNTQSRLLAALVLAAVQDAKGLDTDQPLGLAAACDTSIQQSRNDIAQ